MVLSIVQIYIFQASFHFLFFSFIVKSYINTFQILNYAFWKDSLLFLSIPIVAT